MLNTLRVLAVVLGFGLGLRPTTATAAEGNNTVPILVVVVDAADCGRVLSAGHVPRLAHDLAKSAGEYLLSCVDRDHAEVSYLSSATPGLFVSGGLEGARNEVRSLAAAHKDYAVYVVGQGRARWAAIRLARSLAGSVRVAKLVLVP